jgi:hypothetical protein
LYILDTFLIMPNTRSNAAFLRGDVHQTNQAETAYKENKKNDDKRTKDSNYRVFNDVDDEEMDVDDEEMDDDSSDDNFNLSDGELDDGVDLMAVDVNDTSGTSSSDETDDDEDDANTSEDNGVVNSRCAGVTNRGRGRGRGIGSGVSSNVDRRLLNDSSPLAKWSNANPHTNYQLNDCNLTGEVTFSNEHV